MIRSLLEEKEWLDLYQIKEDSGKMTKKELEHFSSFIHEKRYIPIIQKILNHELFPIPKKVLLGKIGTDKKRVVYMYPEDENFVLKMIAYKLKKYDTLFESNLYSFQSKNGVQEAIHVLSNKCKENKLMSYKIDIHNYFNSIPVDKMIEMLDFIEDKDLLEFIKQLLLNPNVIYEDQVIQEDKGVMAGTPISPFLANLYLKDLDEIFKNDIYARYSDDIILFAQNEIELNNKINRLLQFIEQKGLTINESKRIKTGLDEPWTFLGITYHNGKKEISDITVQKLKDKLKRKSRSIERWKRKKKVQDERALKAYIKAVNRKLFENPKHSELTWARWYFPIINDVEKLKELDHYIQNCCRYVVYRHYGKKNYNLRYEKLKELGLRSLVNEYYKEK